MALVQRQSVRLVILLLAVHALVVTLAVLFVFALLIPLLTALRALLLTLILVS